MQLRDSYKKQSGLLSNLTGLLIASLACIAILTVAAADNAKPSLGALDVRELVILAVLCGAFAFVTIAVAILFRAVRAARRFEQQAAQEVADLRRNLHASEAIIAAEPMILISFDHGTGPRVLINNLDVAPNSPLTVSKFRSWLEIVSAQKLELALAELFREGRAFNIPVATRDNKPLEADGRLAGGRAILKLRDVEGERRKLAAEIEQQRHLHDEVKKTYDLYDALPMIIWFIGRDGRMEWVNEGYRRAVEAESKTQVIDRQIQLLESRQRGSVMSALGQAKTYRDRHHLIISGERRAFEIVAVPLGSRSAVFASDATVLETTQGELSRQMAAHDRTLDRVSTAVAIYRPDQRLAFFNEAYHQLWRLDPEWLASQPRDGEILDSLRERGLLPVEADYRSWKAKLLDAYRNKEAIEDWWHLPDGRAIHFVAEQRPDGGMTYLFDDVTERLALESRYNELIGVQSETLDHLQEAVAVFATDGRLRLYNPAFARIWKLGPPDLDANPHVDDVIGRCRVLYDDARAWTRIKRSVTAIADSRQHIDGEMNRPDGSVITYAGLPLPDGATLLTFVDITDGKRVELALRERNEALEAADRLKSDFISHVSYELRTPLTNIIGFSELLASPRTGSLNGKQREYLGDIHASSNALQTIINDILDLATIDAGTFELRLAQVSPRDVLEGASAAIRDRLKRAKMGLDVQIAPDVETFLADGNRVSHVIYNLLSNAIGFSDQGKTIKLRCVRDNDMIVFTIEDEGCGIPEDQQARVFERFESHARRGRHRGAGLGLAIVKSLVELHGGDVSLRSEPHEGTCVAVRFPINGFARREDEIDDDSLAAAVEGDKVDAA